MQPPDSGSAAESRTKIRARPGPAFLFDLDGTLVDSVYQHVLAWREALEAAGIELAVWRIHRRIGMSGGLFVNALLRETGLRLSAEETKRLQRLHADAYALRVAQVRPLPGARDLLAYLAQAGVPFCHRHEGTPRMGNLAGVGNFLKNRQSGVQIIIRAAKRNLDCSLTRYFLIADRVNACRIIPSWTGLLGFSWRFFSSRC